jgi:RHS repeat-associated protein
MIVKVSSRSATALRSAWNLLSSFVVLMLILVGPAAKVSAQHSNNMGVPAESRTGQSAPSVYARDKTETVNLANGNFSLSIPLTTIGGRGSAAYTVALSYNSKVWSAQQDIEFVLDNNGSLLTHYSAMYEKDLPEYEPGLAKLGGGWTIRLAPGIKGKVIGLDHRPTNVFPLGCHNSTDGLPDCGFEYVLTKMWLSLPDGSQVELRDTLTQGAPALNPNPVVGVTQLIDRDRGRVWRSTDGSNVIFIRDQNNPNEGDGSFFFPSGWVFLPDGSRMRMEAGAATKLIDRNGNFITLGNRYIDQLGRETFVETAGNTVTVRVKGYGIDDRSVSINTGLIGDLDNLREDFRLLQRPFTTGDAWRDHSGNVSEHMLETAHTDLFTESEGRIAYQAFEGADVGDRTAVTRLNLLDGRFFRFRYNQYGEVAEITYPGGGVSEINYTGGVTSVCDVSAPLHTTLNRRVAARRSITDPTNPNAPNPDATWLYLQNDEVINGVVRPGFRVEAHKGGPTGPLLSSEKHFFLKLGAGSEYRNCTGNSTGTGNEKWENGKEFRTETQIGTGTIVTIREWTQPELVWGNDAGLSYNNYRNKHGQDQAPNDPRVARADTILENGRMQRVSYEYDQFNNVTQVNEYDFGDTNGSVGPLRRQTLRTYVTSLHQYCYANLNPLDPGCGTQLATDVNSIIYQPRLPATETIKDANGQTKASSSFEYDTYSAEQNHHAIIPNAGMTSFDGSRFAAFISDYEPRGNATKTSRWAGGSIYISSFSQYDNAGNVVWTKDPNNNVTTVSYNDNFGSGISPDSGAIGVAGQTFAFATLATNALGHQARMQYDYSLGAVTGAKDANGIVTRAEFDSLGRPFRVTAALGLPEQTVAMTSYPSSTVNESTASRQLDATRWLVAKTMFDGFDRPVMSLQSENSSQPGTGAFTIAAETKYDALGRAEKVSNPYRPASEGPVFSTTVFDLGGRIKSLTTPDGSVINTYYNSNQVLVRDQSGRERMSETDALGQLSDVWEITSADDATEAITFPGRAEVTAGYRTKYEYDTLGNLTRVTQRKGTAGSTQTRNFVYDSLSRLVSALNPESGTTTYSYDPNGNLTGRTDARSITANYSYDALNRNTTVNYSDTAISPDITRVYDGASNGIGRLYETFAGGNLTLGTIVEHNKIAWYDALGRPRDLRQRFKYNGVWKEYQTQRSYNLAGGVMWQIYPSGHNVAYNYDGAGRVADKDGQSVAFSGNLGDGVARNYSRGLSYSALGGLSQEQLGTDTAIYNKVAYNSRGQFSEVKVSTVANDSSWNRGKFVNWYSLQCGGAACNATDNNGNLRKQETFIPNNEQNSSATSWYQQYEYDSLNRLTEVHERASSNNALLWHQSYSYDRYGNRSIQQSGTTPGVGINNTQTSVVASSTTNRLYGPGETEQNHPLINYDAAGNQSRDYYSLNGVGYDRTYDAENRMKSSVATYTSPSGTQTSTYTYNADGQRVRRNIGGVETWQVYGMDSELLAEYAANAGAASPQKEYGYRNGQLLITADAPTAAARTNVARSTNGGTAVASSYFSDPNWGTYLPIYVNDGSRRAVNSTIWLDNTGASFSDWIEINFNAAKTIDEIDVVTQQDTYQNPTEPTLAQTFSLYGITAFEVQYWNGSSWTTVPGGSVTGNNKVWRQFTFPAVTTSKVRVLVNGGVDNTYSRVVEVEAWTAAAPAGSATATLNWLVTDQLGTPRLVIDKTGSLAGVKRHDYLPFGEELTNQGPRTTALGYSVADGVRQKFTSQERDPETGLDYFNARYYASTIGRFTSPDPFSLQKEMLTDPQRFNLYAYVTNNPLLFVDPTGMVIDTSRLSKSDLEKWGAVLDVIYAEDLDGNAVNPTLRGVFERLNNDRRTFFIENHSFGEMSGSIGLFTITKHNGVDDFSEAVLKLDFEKVEKLESPTESKLVPGFKKFDGLLGKTPEERAELFGHEGGHGIYALDNLVESVGLQSLIDERDKIGPALYPQPLHDEIDRRLDATERFAQQTEQTINSELRDSLKRKP